MSVSFEFRTLFAKSFHCAFWCQSAIELESAHADQAAWRLELHLGDGVNGAETSGQMRKAKDCELLFDAVEERKQYVANFFTFDRVFVGSFAIAKDRTTTLEGFEEVCEKAAVLLWDKAG
jgi:hypothetical protein